MLTLLSITIDDVLKWFIRLFVFFLPIIWLPGITQNNLQNLFFDFGCLAIFFIAILTKEKRKFTNYNIPIIFLYCSIFSIFSRTFSPMLLHLLCGFLFYYAIITTMNRDEIYNIARILLFVAWINILALFFQILGKDLIYCPKDSVEAMAIGWPVKCGFMGLNKHLAIFLALASGFCYSYCWFFIILILGIIIYLKSLTALIGFLVIILLFISKKRKINIMPYLITLPIISVIFIFSTNSFYKFSVRWETWSVALKDIFRNIFWGKGFGNFNIDVPVSWVNNTKEIINNAPTFNEYIKAMSEFGLLPFLIIALSVFLYFRKLYLWTKQYNDVQILFRVVMAILAMCLFQDLLHSARLGGPILLIVALFELSMITKKEAEVYVTDKI